MWPMYFKFWIRQYLEKEVAHWSAALDFRIRTEESVAAAVVVGPEELDPWAVAGEADLDVYPAMKTIN